VGRTFNRQRRLWSSPCLWVKRTRRNPLRKPRSDLDGESAVSRLSQRMSAHHRARLKTSAAPHPSQWARMVPVGVTRTSTAVPHGSPVDERALRTSSDRRRYQPRSARCVDLHSRCVPLHIGEETGVEALAMAMTERCAITIVYESGWQQPKPRMITPHLVLEVHGVSYMIAHGHQSGAGKTFRLDRIRECWLA
jgi:WYL domain